MDGSIDFEQLGADLLGDVRSLLSSWLPGGKQVGKEYVCGSIRGEQGRSLSINTETGAWADFATGEKGGDLTSLYAAIEGISQKEAFQRLSPQTSVAATGERRVPSVKPARVEIISPPADAPPPSLAHPNFGAPVKTWTYTSKEGEVLFLVCRYDDHGKKTFLPWAYSEDGWVTRSWPAPRPLFNLPALVSHPNAPILIVEGEKACEAAQSLVGNFYVAVTWPNGSQAVLKTDWSPIYGRKILIWPDADAPGIKASEQIAGLLAPHCPEIKILSTEGLADGYDAADWTGSWPEFVAWAKPRARTFKTTAVAAPAPVTINTQINISIKAKDEPWEVPASVDAALELSGVTRQRNGNPICNLDSVRRILENWPPLKGVVWFDDFYGRTLTRKGAEGFREWYDEDEINLLTYLQRYFCMQRLGIEAVRQAIRAHGRMNRRNAPKDWLNSLVWDQKPRIQSFFNDFFGVEASLYSGAVSQNFWISMAARILNPGCKVDNMVILEGGQGVRKTTALEAIASRDWYGVAHDSLQSKDFYLCLQGKLLVEIGELEGFSKADASAIKKIISTPVDRFRVPYGDKSEDFPRHCIFVGTTNEDCYLRDVTGGRRFWPLQTQGEVNVEGIKEVREQLFAEAAFKFKSGSSWWDMPNDETRAEQEIRRDRDDWESAIREFLEGLDEVRSLEVAKDCLKIELAKLSKWDQMRIRNCLKALGWTSDHRSRCVIDGEIKQVRVWRRKI